MKNILLINEMDFTNQVYDGLELLKNELDCRFYLISDMDFEPRRPFFEKRFVFDICETLKTIEFIRKQGISFSAALTKSCELVTPLVALLNREFGGINNDPKTAFYCRSKYHMRRLLAESGVPQPHFRLCHTRSELEAAIREIGIPCVAKPVGGHSSFGTFMIRDIKDAFSAGEEYERCQKYLLEQSQMDLKQLSDFSPEELKLMGITDSVNMITDYLVEEYMDGSEISVDCLTQNGITTIMGIAEQVRMVPPYFVEVSETMPFSGQDKDLKAIESLVYKTIDAMGIRNSASHTEIILTTDGPKIVEIACRMGSDNIHDAIMQTTGYHMMAESVRIALGIPLKITPSVKAHYAMQYILPTKAGVLKEVVIPQAVKNNSHVTECRIDAHPGDIIAPPPEGFDFLGYIGVRGTTRQEAQNLLEEVMNQVNVIYE